MMSSVVKKAVPAKTSVEEIWIVDDDRSIRWVLEKALKQAGMYPRCFESADEVLDAMAGITTSNEQPAVLVSDIRMPGTSGLTLLTKVQERFPQLPVIIMTAHSDLESAVSSFQGGAFEYLPKPFDVDEAIAIARRALAASQKSDTPAGDDADAEKSTEIIGEAPAMQEVFRAIGRLSFSNITVLINGQSGTGKELVAQALHRHSPRRNKPFIALNMAARAHAFLRHRGYVTPEDVKEIGPDVLRHRIVLTYEAEAEQVTAEQVVRKVFEVIEVP